MPKPRKMQISLEATPYYHCTSRCVRRAFLCGYDNLTGTSYEHRKQWVEDRILLLAEVFCINICAYAVMSNHLHVVLHINQQQAQSLDRKDVCERWHKIYKGTPLTRRFENGDDLTTAELEAVYLKIEQWRQNLHSISWFMRALNEPIARMANAEDGCTGSYYKTRPAFCPSGRLFRRSKTFPMFLWESRFTSQALLDEKALAACLAYVDLNPIRAKMATTPETSNHTSIKRRIESAKTEAKQPQPLYSFIGSPREPMPDGLPFNFTDYLELVEWTGRVIREDKRGAIPSHLPGILQRLNIDPQNWFTLTTEFERKTQRFVGEADQIREAAGALGYRKPPGISTATALFL